MTIASDDAFEFPVVFPYNQRAEFIDVHCLPFKTVFERPDIHPPVEGAGQAFPLPDDCVIFTTLNEQVMALELLEEPREEGWAIHFMPDFRGD